MLSQERPSYHLMMTFGHCNILSMLFACDLLVCGLKIVTVVLLWYSALINF